MSLPIRYSPMAFYFWLSIIFLTPQILRHLLRRCDLFRPSRDRHRLYPIPITPSVQYHVGDLSYDLWTTLLHFPFLAFSLYPMHSFVVRPITDHCTTQSGPYHMFRHTWTLCSFYLSFVFKTFVSTPKKKEVFPRTQISFYCFTSLHLAPSYYFAPPMYFALSLHPEPSSCTTLHFLILCRETISLLPNHTPQNHIGHTLRSPSPLIFVTS